MMFDLIMVRTMRQKSTLLLCFTSLVGICNTLIKVFWTQIATYARYLYSSAANRWCAQYVLWRNTLRRQCLTKVNCKSVRQGVACNEFCGSVAYDRFTESETNVSGGVEGQRCSRHHPRRMCSERLCPSFWYMSGALWQIEMSWHETHYYHFLFLTELIQLYWRAFVGLPDILSATTLSDK